nr:heterocyst differentiation protein [Calothrix sp. MO_167.B42]
IPDDVALTLTQLFYRNLSQGYSVDLCVNRMRQGLISAYGSHQMYWALPILYLHSESNGFLCPGMDLPETDELFDEYDPQLTSNIYAQTNRDSQLDFPLSAIDNVNLGANTAELAWWDEEDGLHDLDLDSDIDYEDSSYADDSAIVSDLFRQLDLQKSAGGESTVTGELQQSSTDTHLQQGHISEDGSSLWGEEQNHGSQSSKPQELGAAMAISGVTSTNEPSNPLTTISGNGNARKTTSKTNRKPKSIWSVINLQGNQRNVIGVVGVGAIASIIGLGWWWQNQQSNLPDIPPIPPQSASVEQPPINLKTSATGIVTAYASEKLSKGDLRSGLRAVEELLNRNALKNAETTLKLVDSEHKENPSVNFLWGRLIWQLIQTKDKTYSIDDARRHWEVAVKAEPNSPLYSTVLGFAYYAEGNLNKANHSWFKAIDIAVKQKNSSTAPQTILLEEEMNQNPLTAYAGLVIGLYKAAPQQHNAKQEQYLNEAIKLRQMVLKEDPVNFQLKELAKNWLWSEDAMKDWKSLLAKQSIENKNLD